MMRDRIDLELAEQVKLSLPLPQIRIWLVYKDRDLSTEPALKFISQIMDAGLRGAIRPE